MPSIYLAGKISKNDWRHTILPGLRQRSTELFHGWSGQAYSRHLLGWGLDWQPIEQGVFGMDYVGPFFMGCDHGCAHGPHSHGSAADGSYGEDISNLSKDVATACYQAIKDCDVFFAWLGGDDATTAHGTLVELGYARALNKEIWIASDKEDKDLWFAFTMESDNETVVTAPGPVAAVKALAEKYVEEHLREARRALLESPLEEAFYDAWLESLPPQLDGLVPQYEVEVSGSNYRLDFAIPERKIAYEMDGKTYHGTLDAMERDHRRDLKLKLAGWQVHRFGGDMIRESAREVVRLAAALADLAPPVPADSSVA